MRDDVKPAGFIAPIISRARKTAAGYSAMQAKPAWLSAAVTGRGVLFVAAFASVGVTALFTVYASAGGSAIIASPHSGSIAGNASAITNKAANGGTAVSFGYQSSSSATTRSPYTWPFSWDSIWNMPIASTATYVQAGIISRGSYEDNTSSDYDSVNPSFPVVTLENAQLASGNIGAVDVHGDPNMSAGGEWNTCSAFLGTDNETVYQGQTTELTAGGDPEFGGTADDTWAPVSITGAGIEGCHGGSGLSGLGGTLTLSDLTQPGPITHALKIALDGYLDYSEKGGGFRWPATNADSAYNDPSSVNYYGGSNPNVVEGSLLALPRSISPSSFSNPTVARLAQAMQDYGVYIVDNTGTAQYGFSTLITNYNASAQLVSDLCTAATPCGYPSDNDVFSSQMETLFEDLEVVANNTASTPGGGAIGADRCAPYAPPFSGGSDTPPAVTVISCSPSARRLAGRPAPSRHTPR
jgi:hypothetical protein